LPSRFWGTDLSSADTPAEKGNGMNDHTAPPAAPPRQPALTSADLGRGWKTAVLHAVLTALVLLLLAQALIVLAYFAADDPSKPSALMVARFGGVLFYAFHHVGFAFDVPRGAMGADAPFNVSAGGVIALAAMTGTILGLWLLARGGRAVADDAGGSSFARGFHGLKVAPPYAVLALAGSFLLRFKPEDGGIAPTIHPSYVAALLWPLALAAVAGFVGGFRSGPVDASTELVSGGERWVRRVRGAVAGGWGMIVYGLVFAFAGLLVMAVVKPDATADYFSVFDQGALTGIVAIVATLLVLPNMAAWVLFPAMGSCVGLSGPISICFLSYAHFPRDLGEQVAGASDPSALTLPSAPPGYFLFLLVPLAAVVLGGMVAARKGSASSRNEAVGLGALAGVVFAILSLITIVLASISFKISGGISPIGFSGSFRLGPELVSGVVFSLLWGVVGGALGGLWEGRTLPTKAVAAPGVTPPPGQWSATPEAAAQPAAGSPPPPPPLGEPPSRP
jgi:uncharacterized protein DUF6350